MEEVCNFLKECKVFFISTIDGDKPRVRPFGVAEIYNNHLSLIQMNF